MLRQPKHQTQAYYSCLARLESFAPLNGIT